MDYELSIAIDAPPGHVWTVLTDVERWPEWTASMTSVTYIGGDRLALGSRVRIKQPRMPALEWEVTEFAPQQSFSWLAKSGGITTLGLHHLTPGLASGVTVRFGLRQSGSLAWLIGLLTSSMTCRYVRMEAEGLKRRCEAAAQAASE